MLLSLPYEIAGCHERMNSRCRKQELKTASGLVSAEPGTKRCHFCKLIKLKFSLNSSAHRTIVPLWKCSITFSFVIAVSFYLPTPPPRPLWTSQKSKESRNSFHLKHFSSGVSSSKFSDLIPSSLKALHNLKGKRLPGHGTRAINLWNPVSGAASSVVNPQLCTGE